MCELTFITEIQDLQCKIPITVKLITCEQAMWLKNGKKVTNWKQNEWFQ
jgi:hypothetical protein